MCGPNMMSLWKLRLFIDLFNIKIRSLPDVENYYDDIHFNLKK